MHAATHAATTTAAARPTLADPDDTDFNVVARRNELLGLLVGRLIGHGDLSAYARRVVEADHREPGHDDVIAFLAEDLRGRGIAFKDEDLNAMLRQAQSLARLQFAATD